MFSSFKNATVLAFGAHPDDIEIGCGGTLLKLIAAGHNVNHAIVTKGEEGSLTIDKQTLAQTRRSEALAAAKSIGAKSVHFFEYEDGFTHYNKAMKIQVIEHIRHVRPDILFVHAHGDNQPDHQLVTRLVLEAMASASGPWFPDAKGKPHQPQLVLGYEVWSPISRPQLVVNISNTLANKLLAIEKFVSQTTDIDYAKAIRGLAEYRSLLTKDNEPAEAFEIIFSQEF